MSALLNFLTKMMCVFVILQIFNHNVLHNLLVIPIQCPSPEETQCSNCIHHGIWSSTAFAVVANPEWQVDKSWLEATRSLVWQETVPSLYIGSFQADFSVSLSVCGADESVLIFLLGLSYCQSLNNLDQSTGRYHTVLLEDTGCYRKPHDPSKTPNIDRCFVQ